MINASFELALSINPRIRELTILADEARKAQDKDEGLYNALCRSTCVLLASHLEGYIKDLSRSIVNDLAYNLKSFSRMPLAIQRTFCRKIAYYEGVSNADIETRIRQLIVFFSKNSIDVDMSAFSYKESANRNPLPTIIEVNFERLGIPNILSSFATPAFEVVFDNNIRTNYQLNRDMKKFTSHLYHFPFRPLPEPYSLSWKKASKSEKDVQTLWHTFIEAIMTRRHTIAHGDTLSNETSWEELQRDYEKMRILMYGLVFSSASYLMI